jgi:AcrR family transcriptional regulator
LQNAVAFGKRPAKKKGGSVVALGRPRAFDTQAALDRAIEVFWRKGYEGASLVDLTTAMGISAPSLYAAFGNKEGLFRAALERYGEHGAALLAPVLAAPTARQTAALFLAVAVSRATDPETPHGCMLVQSGLSCGAEASFIPEELARRRKEMELALRHRFERAQAEGELSRHSDPAALARFLVVTANGMSVHASAGTTREELQAVAAIAMTAWPDTADGLDKTPTCAGKKS